MKKLLAVLLLCTYQANQAGTLTGTLNLQAQVADTCIMVADDINFGVIVLASGNSGKSISSGRIRTTCTKDTQYTIKLGAGNSGNLSNGRYMTSLNSTDNLEYELFSRRNLTTVWGDGTAGTYTVVNVATGQEDVETIEAQVPLNQIAKAGVYRDSIIVTIDY